jgi:hypothetical protein
MKELEKIAQELRETLLKKQEELKLTFEEESHTYTMLDQNGNLSSKFPSVSKIMKLFYDEFPTEKVALNKSGGDPYEAEKLIQEWAILGKKSTDLGSRCHFYLEEHTINEFGISKELRKPKFDCDAEQIVRSDSMITAGKKYIDLQKERGCVLVDTEIVLGHPLLGYTGQPDKVWLVTTPSGAPGLLITDWKSNKSKNFQVTKYTKKMKKPFEDLPDNALGHYNTQLPLYGKLILKMLEGSKFESLPLLGCIIVLIKDDGEFEEFRVSRKTIHTILEMDMNSYLTS